VRVLFLGPASASHVTRWVRHLRDRGHEVRLASMHAIPPAVSDGSVPLADRLTEGPTRLPTLLQAVGRTRRAFREFQPDVVCAYYMASYGLLAALSRVRPWVGAAAGGDVLVDPFDGLGTKIRNGPVLRVVLGRAAGMLAWAPHVAERLEQLGVPPQRILVQPRGVNRSLFGYRPPRERSPEEPLRIFSLRWLKPLYRVDTLIRALGHLDRDGIPFEARIAGEGSEQPKLETLAREQGLANKTAFVGRLEADDVPDALQWADVYVSTSSSDGASSSLFEAMSVGCYPVVTDIPANRGLVDDGRTGALFPVGDDVALAARLTTLARDDARRRAAIEAGRDFVADRLDYDRNMRRIESFLEAVARGQDNPAVACGRSPA
jgi:glycosyltransferase involved in cell wall biosynthesis